MATVSPPPHVSHLVLLAQPAAGLTAELSCATRGTVQGVATDWHGCLLDCRVPGGGVDMPGVKGGDVVQITRWPPQEVEGASGEERW